jgi:hypothetical protein
MTNPTHKATVSIGDKVITFEGPRDFIEEQVARYIEISSKSQARLDSDPLKSSSAHLSFRELVELKKPRGHSELVAVLAFGLAESGIQEFSESEMRRAYIRAEVRPPKVVSQALRDAKNKQDYVESGKKRGTYKLSSHGDRTVRFDLPRG